SEQRIANDLSHVPDRTTRRIGGGETSDQCLAGAAAIACVDKEVGCEVLKEVEDDCLDDEREEDAAWNVSLRIFRLCGQRGRRFKADHQQDRNGGLIEQSTEAMWHEDTQWV